MKLKKQFAFLLSILILLSFLAYIPVKPVYAASVCENYNTGDDTSYSAYGANWLSQTFTTNSTGHSVTSIKFKVYRSSTPGTVTVSIRNTDSAGNPVGADLAFGTINGNTFTTASAGAWNETIMTSEYTLYANQKYAIIVRATTGTSSKRVYWRGDMSTPTYTGGNQLTSANSGGTWTSNTGIDLMFEVYGNLTSPTLLAGWNYYRQINITNATGSGANYTIPITVVNGTGSDVTGANPIVYVNNHFSYADFRDVRFTDENGALLCAWNKSTNSGSNVTCWVNVGADLSSVNRTIYLYYGNVAASAYWNGTSTFPLFDTMDNYYSNPAWTTHTMTKDTTTYVDSGASAKMVDDQSAYITRASDKAICAWVNLTSLTDTHVAQLVSLWDGTATRVAQAAVSRAGSLYNWSMKTYTGAWVTTTSTTTLSLSKWYFIQLLQNGLTFYLYVDGTLVLTKVLASLPTATLVSMGRQGNGVPTATMYLDDFLVRKYVSPEPLINAFGTEVILLSTTYPTIEDFWINSTKCADVAQFAFYVSDEKGLSSATFGCNSTGSWVSNTTSYSGTSSWANFTSLLGSTNATVLFGFNITNTGSLTTVLGNRTMRIYNDTLPFTYLGNAIETVEAANTWSEVDNYTKVCLDQADVTVLQTMIDNYSAFYNPERLVYAYDNVSNGWTDGLKAYDNNTATYAQYVFSGAGPSPILWLNLTTYASSVLVQLSVDRAGVELTDMDIWVSNGTGTNVKVATTTPTYDHAYHNITITQSMFNAIGFNFTSTGDNPTAAIYEMQVINNTYTTCDWRSVLQWSAICEKLGMSWANQQNDVLWALGNATMVGSLPHTTWNLTNVAAFSPQDKWALYGYYYAVEYGGDLAKWNITAAYEQFNVSVVYSVEIGGSYGGQGLPLWIYSNDKGETVTNRYYDEDACTIDCYLIFNQLLNVSDAMTQALYWWSYINVAHWNTVYNHYGYSGTNNFECEAAFFLKITSLLKYYYPSVGNYSRVLTDIATRFLQNEWNSYQWLGADGWGDSNYVVVHQWSFNPPDINPQTRLMNTLAAWQALEGAYMQINSTYQANMIEMLNGNGVYFPAWALLLTPYSQLFNSTTNLFNQYSDGTLNDPQATGYGEELLFLLGIVPGTTTVAYPLQELKYEDIYDIDPYLFRFQLNSTSRIVRLPVVQAGTITFQYGVSPITCTFGQPGIYEVSFSASWNNIVVSNMIDSLPSNVIYFYVQAPQYDSLSVSSQVPGQSCIFSVHWYTTTGIAVITTIIFGTNNTGTWVNATYSGLSTTDITETNTTTLNTTDHMNISYVWYCADSYSNQNNTGIITFTLLAQLNSTGNILFTTSFSSSRTDIITRLGSIPYLLPISSSHAFVKVVWSTITFLFSFLTSKLLPFLHSSSITETLSLQSSKTFMSARSPSITEAFSLTSSKTWSFSQFRIILETFSLPSSKLLSFPHTSTITEAFTLASSKLWSLPHSNSIPTTFSSATSKTLSFHHSFSIPEALDLIGSKTLTVMEPKSILATFTEANSRTWAFTSFKSIPATFSLSSLISYLTGQTLNFWSTLTVTFNFATSKLFTFPHTSNMAEMFSLSSSRTFSSMYSSSIIEALGTVSSRVWANLHSTGITETLAFATSRTEALTQSKSMSLLTQFSSSHRIIESTWKSINAFFNFASNRTFMFEHASTITEAFSLASSKLGLTTHSNSIIEAFNLVNSRTWLLTKSNSIPATFTLESVTSAFVGTLLALFGSITQQFSMFSKPRFFMEIFATPTSFVVWIALGVILGTTLTFSMLGVQRRKRRSEEP